MGKGTIISGGTDGKYQVELVYNRDRLQTMIDDLEARKSDLQDSRSDVQSDRDDKAPEKDAAVSDLQDYQSDLIDMYEQMQLLQQQLQDVTMEITELENELEDMIEMSSTTTQAPATTTSDPSTTTTPWPTTTEAPEWTIEDQENSIAAKEEEKAQLTIDIRDLETDIAEQETITNEQHVLATNLTYELALLDGQLSAIDLDITAIDKRLEELNNQTPEDETVEAWCADFTEDLSGTVGTVEVPGEKKVIQVQPGYEGNAAYTQSRDGQLFPTIAMTPAQAYYNYAMMPGWQKWRPTFRHGTITSIDRDSDTANVTLDEALSSAQDLDVNQGTSLSSVPVEYMYCNALPFEEGDNVLVMFDNYRYENPKIIGFKEEPKPCIRYIAYRSTLKWIIEFPVNTISTSDLTYPPRPDGYDRERACLQLGIYTNAYPQDLGIYHRGAFFAYAFESDVAGLAAFENETDARQYMAEQEHVAELVEQLYYGDVEQENTPYENRVFYSGGIWPALEETTTIGGTDYTHTRYAIRLIYYDPTGLSSVEKDFDYNFTTIDISDTAANIEWTDSQSTSKGVYIDPDQDSVSTLFFSEDVSGDEVEISVSLDLNDFPDALIYEGQRFVPRRFLHFAHSAPDQDNDIYVEYINENATEEAT